MAVRGRRFTSGEADLSVRGLLLDIDRFASHDGPGIRTAVFMKGCPLACQWCHSPESRGSGPELLYQPERCTGCWLCLAACPAGALRQDGQQGRGVAGLDRSRCTACGQCVEVCYPGALRRAGRVVSVGELAAVVERDRPFFQHSGGGVTLSGGEPARQPGFAYHFLLACKERGIHTALETTGYARWGVMAALARVADLLLYDLKLIDPAAHRSCTGVSNRMILANLRRLAGLGHEIQVRVPCIPGVNDSRAQVRSLVRFVASLGITRMALLPYNGAAGAKYAWIGRPFALADTESQSQAYMQGLAEIGQQAGLHVQVGG